MTTITTLETPINSLLEQARQRAGKRWKIIAAGSGLLKVLDPACQGKQHGQCFCATFNNDSYALKYARLQARIGQQP